MWMVKVDVYKRQVAGEAGSLPALQVGERIAALILLGLAALLGLFPGLLTALAARLAG